MVIAAERRSSTAVEVKETLHAADVAAIYRASVADHGLNPEPELETGAASTTAGNEAIGAPSGNHSERREFDGTGNLRE